VNLVEQLFKALLVIDEWVFPVSERAVIHFDHEWVLLVKNAVEEGADPEFLCVGFQQLSGLLKVGCKGWAQWNFRSFLVADQCLLNGTVRLKHLQDPEPVIVCNRQDGIASVIQGIQFYQVVSSITFSVFPAGDTGAVPSNEYILDHEEHVAV
jgi:hypothetical protein